MWVQGRPRVKGCNIGTISNDVVSKEDEERMRKNLVSVKGLIPEELVIGLAKGGCPHTAVTEDPSMNLRGGRNGSKTHRSGLIVIESGDDNIATTFTSSCKLLHFYIIDVTGGDKYPRKRGLGRDMRPFGNQ